MIASRLSRLSARRRLENLQHLRRKLAQEIVHALERLRFQRRARNWPESMVVIDEAGERHTVAFKSEAAWQAWCAKDREDELGELLQCEHEFELETARFEGRHALDPAPVRKRRAA